MLNHLLRDYGQYAASRQIQLFLDDWEVGEESTLEGSGAIHGDAMGYTPASVPTAYFVTINEEGIATIDSSGDESQQSFQEDLYSILLRSWTGNVTNYVNPHAPELANPSVESIQVFVATGAAFSADLNAQFTDPDGDSLTLAISPDTEDPIPAPVTLTAGVLGTTAPGSAAIHNLLIRATDPSGLYAEILVNLVVGNQTVPDVLGELQAAAEDQLAALYFGIAYNDPGYSDEYEVGEIMAQSPAGTTSAAGGSTVTLTVSRGVLPPSGGRICSGFGFGFSL